MVLENEDFSDEDQCQCMCNLKFFAYVLFVYCKYPFLLQNDQQIK